jgi:hypothetical protein
MISWATVPTTISERAVEILNQMASSVARSANPTQTAARNQTFSTLALLSGPIRERAVPPGLGGTQLRVLALKLGDSLQSKSIGASFRGKVDF